MPEPTRPALRKVCGITRACDAVHAAGAGASAIGMVFYPPSPRSVDIRAAREIAASIPTGVLRVGVFVNERPRTVARAVREVPLDVVQLHGNETPPAVDRIRSAIGTAAIWKAFRVGQGFDAAALSTFAADAFLLDTAHGELHGGTGRSFSWHLAVPAKGHGPVILAGGLDGSNVAEAVRQVAPWGVDASSRLEAMPGRKDRQKVEQFLLAAGWSGSG